MDGLRRLIHEVHRRSLWQVLGIYGAASWVVIQVVDALTESAGLPDWVQPFALVLLLIGFPVVAATAFVQEGLPGGSSADRARQSGGAGGPGKASSPASSSAAPSAPPANLAAGTGVLDRPSTRPKPIRRALTWRNALFGGVAAFALLGAAVAFYFLMRITGFGPAASLMAQGVLDERDAVVLADFDNLTSDPTAADVVTEALRVDLLDSRVLTLVGPARIREVLARMRRSGDTILSAELAREIAVREGFKAVIQGEVTAVGSGYVLTASVVAAETGDPLAAFRENARDGDALVGAVDKLSERIRERVGESLRSIRNGEPLGNVTTASLDALRKYTEAIRLSDRGEYAQAIALLEEAVQLDTTFAMAYRKLSVLLGNAGGVDPVRIRDAAMRAYQHRDRLTEAERYHATARYHATVTGDAEAETQAYLGVLRINPDDGAAANNLALNYMAEDRFEDAATLLERSVGLPMGDRAVRLLNLIECYLKLGRLDAARSAHERLQSEAPEHFFVAETAILIALHTSDAAAAHEQVRQFVETDNAPAIIRTFMMGVSAFADLESGKFAEARTHVAEVVRSANARGLPAAAVGWRLGEAGITLSLLGDTAGARRIVLDDVSERFEAMPPERRLWFPYTSTLAGLGLVDRARMVYARWDAELPPEERGPDFAHDRRIAEADILAASGDLSAALRTVDQVRAERRCQRCFRDRLAEWHARNSEIAEAITLYEKMSEEPDDLAAFPLERLVAIHRLGPLYEQAGEPGKAAAAYARFAEMWKDADPELQPRVRAALERARRLTAEPGTTD